MIDAVAFWQTQHSHKVWNSVSLVALSPSNARWKWQKSPRSFSNYDIVQRLRPYNLHFPLSLKFNAIVYEQVAVVVAVVFPKLSNSDTLRLVSSQENYSPVRKVSFIPVFWTKTNCFKHKRNQTVRSGLEDNFADCKTVFSRISI